MTTMPSQFRNLPERRIWWMHPAFPFAATSAVAGLAAYAIPNTVYEQLWRTPKYYGGTYLTFTVLCILAFVFGCILSQVKLLGSAANPLPGRWTDHINWSSAWTLFRISVVLCLIGYACWIGVAVQRGLNLKLVLGAFSAQKGATYELRDDYLGTVSGITTLTQFGIPAIVFGMLLGFSRGWKQVRIPMACVIVLALFRVVINSERLALIELVIPIVILWVHFRYASASRRVRTLPIWLKFAPIIGVVAVFSLFTAAEYTRSWVTFYQGGNQTLIEFAGERLLGYYATALNNGALLMERVKYPLNAPIFTFHFLYRFPLIGPSITEMVPDQGMNDQQYYMDMLATNANPEFNNPNGIMLPILDFGLGGGLLYWIIMGLIVGAAYRSFVRESIRGLCWYPTLFIGLMEAPRILYWSDGRFFPAACMLLLGTILMRKRPRRERIVIPLPGDAPRSAEA